MKKSEIHKILRDHKKWLDTNGRKGKQADFSNVNLHGINFCGLDLSAANFFQADLNNADLRGAYFMAANFCRANLNDTNFHGANLSYANFTDAFLTHADLRNVKFYGANLTNVIFTHSYLTYADLRNANFQGSKILLSTSISGASLPNGIYMVGGTGGKQINTYYDVVNDFIKCGCWDDGSGNHLYSFKKRIEDIYGKNGKTPNLKHYKAYQAAIHYFEVCRDEYVDE